MRGSTVATFLLAGAALAASVPAAADVKAGVDAWTRGDYATAIKEWQGPAAKGDADAQFNLAQAYRLGRGVKQDVAKAEDLFGKAAAQGHPQASDNYGLLLFQRGERTQALPYVQAAADRGDPRAQYLLGVACFNGDGVPKDWVRAYALTSLAQAAGLAQASAALTQMDQHIPLEQRQQAATLAADLAEKAQANRARQFAAADLGARSRTPAAQPAALPSPVLSRPTPPPAHVAESPRTAGADYARPQRPAPAAAAPMPKPKPEIAQATPRPAPPAAKPAEPKPITPKPPTTAAAPHPAATGGPWRIQIGAFGVPGNAEAMWNRVKGHPALAGHGKLLVPAGKVTKLQAGGFASQGEAQAACSRLGVSCIPTRN